MKKASLLLKLFVFVNLSLGCLFVVAAYAATLEVCPTGCLYSSIQAGIHNAAPGDIVLVHDGIYVENINFSGKAVTVKSVNGPAGTIIDGNANGSVVRFISGEGSGSVIDGFTIRNGSGSEGSGGGIYCNSSSPVITNCTITGNSTNYGGGIYCDSCSPTITNSVVSGNTALTSGGIGFRTSSPTVANCTISGNTGIWVGGGIACDWGTSATITNCIITGNTSEKGGGIYGYTSSSTITNCTIAGNTATASGGGLYLDNASASVKNSILWGSAPDQFDHSGSSGLNLLVYTDIDHNFGEEFWKGNIRQNPLFVDPANGDYRLQPTSPCIDAGTSDDAPTTDKEGFARYDDPLVPNTGGGTYPYYDMGAHEKLDPFHTLTVEKKGIGKGSVSATGLTCPKNSSTCTGTYETGTEISITAKVNSGSIFGGWTGCDTVSGNVCVVRMDRDISVEAPFLGKPVPRASPSSINFGRVKRGATSEVQSVTLRNNGAQEFGIASVTVTDTNSADFSTSYNCPNALARNESCTISLTLSASDYGKRKGIMHIVLDNPTNTAVNVKLSASAVAPRLTTTPGSLNFGTVSKSGGAVDKPILVYNRGLSDLVISDIQKTGDPDDQFALNHNCGTVTASGYCTITITFTPTVTGKSTGSVTIKSNDPAISSQKVVPISGVGK